MKVFSRIKPTSFKEIYFVFNQIGQLIYIGNKNGYQKLNIFSKLRTTIKRIFNKSKRTFVIIVMVIVGFLFNPLISQPAKAVALINPNPVIQRQRPIGDLYEQSFKLQIGPSSILNQFKRSDKIQMPAFSRPNFKNVAPYVFLNGSNKHGFYKFFHIKGGFQDKYGGLVILAVMILILTQDTEAFTSAFTALQKLGGLNAPMTSPQPWKQNSNPSGIYATSPQQEFNDFLKSFNDPKQSHHFVMSKEEATQKLNDAYPGKQDITPNEFISDYKAAAKIYHASDVGLNPEKYNLSLDNLKRLNSIGLHAYAREGHPLPSIEFVKDYQAAIKKICTDGQSSNGTYSSSGENKVHPARFYHNSATREIVGFYEKTGELITASKYRQGAFNKFLATKNLGNLNPLK